MIDKNEIFDFILPYYEHIIKNELSDKERHELHFCFKYFKIDLEQYVKSIIDFTDSVNTDLATNSTLNYVPSEEPMTIIDEFVNEAKNNEIVNNNFILLNYRISLILQKMLKENPALEESSPIYQRYMDRAELDLIFVGQRFGIPTELKKVIVPQMRTFIKYQNVKFNFTKMRVALQENEVFLKKTLDVNSFEIVFSEKRINPKFNKIAWSGSIFELKAFINELFEKKVLVKDVNFYNTIVDCFTINGNNIELKQLASPKGSKKRINFLKEIISNSFNNF